jgi:hypothetical protein
MFTQHAIQCAATPRVPHDPPLDLSTSVLVHTPSKHHVIKASRQSLNIGALIIACALTRRVLAATLSAQLFEQRYSWSLTCGCSPEEQTRGLPSGPRARGDRLLTFRRSLTSCVRVSVSPLTSLATAWCQLAISTSSQKVVTPTATSGL